MVTDLWTEKYRPTTISDYVFKNANQKAQIQGWITDGGIPHLLFYGGPGTGKTTLAKVLITDLGIHSNDVMYINASRDNGVELIRQKITNFSETMPWGSFKVILLDEADRISPEGQGALRGVMEQYHSVVRFILTCNYEHMIIPAIHSRCQSMHISNLDQMEFTIKIAEILADNAVEFDLETIDAYVKATYPDLRKTINSVQLNVTNGKLINPEDLQNTDDWKINMVGLFRKGQLRKAREWICKHATPDEYNSIFTFLYQNLEFFGATDEEQDAAIIIIRDGIVKHTQVADPEINLSATMIQLEKIGK